MPDVPQDDLRERNRPAGSSGYTKLATRSRSGSSASECLIRHGSTRQVGNLSASNRIIVAFAGGAAERLVGGEPDGHPSGDDWRILCRALREVTETQGVKQAAESFRCGSARAEELVLQQRAAVETLAPTVGRLIHKPSADAVLSHDEAVDLVRGVWEGHQV